MTKKEIAKDFKDFYRRNLNESTNRCLEDMFKKIDHECHCITYIDIDSFEVCFNRYKEDHNLSWSFDDLWDDIYFDSQRYIQIYANKKFKEEYPNIKGVRVKLCENRMRKKSSPYYLRFY